MGRPHRSVLAVRACVGAIMKTDAQNYLLPSRAITSGGSAVLSIACFIWLLLRSHRPQPVIIIHQIGWESADFIILAGTLLAAVALACCLFSWKSEKRPEAAGASIAAAHAVFIWIWLLLRI